MTQLPDADSQSGATATLSDWAAGYRLDDAPHEVVKRMKALVLDHLREVPSRVSVTLSDGRTHTEHVAHPRGSPNRQMSWDELSMLFKDSVADALSGEDLDRVLNLVAGLDRDTGHQRTFGYFL